MKARLSFFFAGIMIAFGGLISPDMVAKTLKDIAKEIK